MKAILLAAGKGVRISRYIGESPKCTLDVGNTSLIRHTADLLAKNNIEIIVVVGYEKGLVMNALDGIRVKYYYNPFYDATNSIASLWFARKELIGDDIIIANADVFWEQEVLDVLSDDTQEQVMLMDSSRNADYLFKCEGTKLINYGKGLVDFTGEYVGIAKIRQPFLQRFSSRLVSMIETQQHSLWWENVLYSFIGEVDINVKDINGLFWSEIDYIEDYNRIIDYRKNKK